MANNILSRVIALLLAICCTILLITLMTTRDKYNSLVEANESLLHDNEYCTTQLEMKFSDMRLKNQQLASLAARVNNLTEERILMLEKIYKLQGGLGKKANREDGTLVDRQV